MSSGIPLFKRVCHLNVDGLVVDALRISFKIQKDKEPDYDRASVKVYNLSPSTRTQLQQTDVQRLRLEAGYDGTTEVIFDGDITRVESARDGEDWVVEFSVGDGVRHGRRKRANVVSKSGPVTALQELLRVYDKGGAGSLAKAFAEKVRSGALTEGVSKYILTGNAKENMAKLSKQLGLAFSIQDGAPTFIPLGAPANYDSDIVLLTPDTGLVGSPELSRRGYVKINAFIQQKLLPGKFVQVRSGALNGYFQIHRVDYNGDTRGAPWFAELQTVQVPFI